MPYTFLGAGLKLTRAKTQLDGLESEVRDFLDADEKPYKITVKRDVKTGEDSVVINISKEPPRMWSVQIGEILHNLRSALDHMVYEIAAIEGKGSVPDKTEFPIFVDEPRFRSTKPGGGLYKIRGLPLSARTVIEQIQPFQRREDPRHHRLWALQELSNWDKHRLLHLTSVVTGASKLRLKDAPGLRVQVIKVRADGEVEDGAELLRYKVLGVQGMQGKVDMEGYVTYGIAFDKTSPANGGLIIDSLNQLVQVVQQVGALLSQLPTPP